MAPPRSHGDIQNVQIASNLNILDLELLHNYSTSTCFTLHSDPMVKTLWRINVPQLGFSYDFVMHSLLAISALHLAHYTPRKKDFYLSQAMHHHQTGLQKATSVLPHVTDENCSALYIFTALTCIFSIASRQNLGDLILGDEGGVTEVVLFRGTRSIIQSSQHALKSGVLGPMFIGGSRRDQLREEQVTDPPQEEDYLNELQRLMNSTTTDPASLPIYTEAIDDLRKSFAVIYKKASHTYQSTDIFIWLFRLSDEYLQRLRQRTQESLVIFAHFCVVPKRLESNWWIEGWSTHLMTRIYAMLDGEHRLWIRWPIEEIGWAPDQDL